MSRKILSRSILIDGIDEELNLILEDKVEYEAGEIFFSILELWFHV